MVAALICNILLLYVFMIIGVAILSFVRVTPGGGVDQLQQLLRRATDPLLVPIRNALSGATQGMPIDFSPLIVILGIQLLRGIIC